MQGKLQCKKQCEPAVNVKQAKRNVKITLSNVKLGTKTPSKTQRTLIVGKERKLNLPVKLLSVSLADDMV